MSAVWRVSRAAVRRRRLQTFVIGLVVLSSAAMVVLALGLLLDASAPFQRAFDQQRGAHVVAAFDPAKVSDAQLAQTMRLPGVRAAAGPYGQAVITIGKDWLSSPPGSLTVVGRADPVGPVDHVQLLIGRWATGPGEIVINWSSSELPDASGLGYQIRAEGVPPLTVVGFATSMSVSADAWVSPGQIAALHPSAVQMLYRFSAAGSDGQVQTSLTKATAGLPAGALVGAQSYLTLKRAFAGQADAYLPFLTVFGIVGLAVSVLIVANVVSGAVVSRYRQIGILKALGFTPRQVLAVYLTMIFVPAAVGGLLGTLLGDLAARPVLRIAFFGVRTGTAKIGTVSPWVPVISLVGMLTLVVLAALIPAVRAGRLPAAQAITAGSAPRAGRGLRVQRWLSGRRLPRSISLGLSQPFARPGRAGLTMAAIVLGVTAVTLATGLTSTMLAYENAGRSNTGPQITVQVGTPGNGRSLPKLSDPQIEARLRALPGARQVTAQALVRVNLAGDAQPASAFLFRGDAQPNLTSQIVSGRWLAGPGEAVVSPAFLKQRRLAVGARLTLIVNGRRTTATIVGESMTGGPEELDVSWPTLAALAPSTRADSYDVQLSPGTDPQACLTAITAADPGLQPTLVQLTDTAPIVAVISFSTVFTVLLSIVAALGVFNTVLLNTQERRRDLGMLASIGMTPRQVVVMTVTSVAGLGAVSGLLGVPLGIVAHRLLVDNVGVVAFPASMKDVWQPAQLAALALVGIVIAVLGALIPARSAARTTIATLLRGE